MSAAPRIIAEIGTSHGGDPAHARQLISAAKRAGADTAKFQLVRADEILYAATGSVDLPGGAVSLYERFRDIERPESFYRDLMEHCRAEGIRFLCTPFGVHSARALAHMGVTEIKIASPELNHTPLLREVASYRIPLLLSTGVSTLGDIAEALRITYHATAVQLLHCITAYPAPEEEYNLRLIPALRDLTGVPVGVSDHSLDPVLVPALATLMGASAIEKHITLSQNGDGLDDAIALEPDDFALMSARVNAIAEQLQRAAADGPVAVRSTELEIETRLRNHYGAARVARVLGSGVKDLAPSESRNYGYSNRSIHAVRDLPAGTVLDHENLAVLRTERNLTPGMHPRYWDTVLGSRLSRAIAAGDGLNWHHVLQR